MLIIMKGDNDPESVQTFIENKFSKLITNPEKTVYAHFTEATNQENMKFIIEDVTDTIIRINLTSVGLQ
jgi:guanine nucleotide-binding protein G(i) subunit alpha